MQGKREMKKPTKPKPDVASIVLTGIVNFLIQLLLKLIDTLI